MPTSTASSGSQSKVLIVVASLALPAAIVAVALLFVFGSSSGGTGSLESVAEPTPEPEETAESVAVGEPTGERDDLEGADDAEQAADRSEDQSAEVSVGGDPIAAAYDELWELGRTFIGGSDPVGVIAALTDQVGPFPVTDDAVVASFSLDVDREERDREIRIQYRTAVRYYSDQSVDEVVALYRADMPSLDLAERETEQGTDDDGDYTDVEFGNFSDHPDPLIWWANLSLQVRADDVGTLVRIFYTVTRTDGAIPTGLLADVEAAIPLAEGYENTSVGVSGFSGDPHVQPTRFRVDFAATATLAAPTASESDELARLADVVSATGNWTLDEQTDSGVWLDNIADDELRNYLTLWMTETETVARYSYS